MIENTWKKMVWEKHYTNILHFLARAFEKNGGRLNRAQIRGKIDAAAKGKRYFN